MCPGGTGHHRSPRTPTVKLHFSLQEGKGCKCPGHVYPSSVHSGVFVPRLLPGQRPLLYIQDGNAASMSLLSHPASLHRLKPEWKHHFCHAVGSTMRSLPLFPHIILII